MATVAAAALGIDLPGVALTGYNETIVGAGLRRAVDRNAQALTGLDVLAARDFAPLPASASASSPITPGSTARAGATST